MLQDEKDLFFKGLYNMGHCVNHPEKETSYKCMKYEIFFCEKCLKCNDPDLYCKFRPSCAIHFLSEKSFDSEDVP